MCLQLQLEIHSWAGEQTLAQRLSVSPGLEKGLIGNCRSGRSTLLARSKPGLQPKSSVAVHLWWHTFYIGGVGATSGGMTQRLI